MRRRRRSFRGLCRRQRWRRPAAVSACTGACPGAGRLRSSSENSRSLSISELNLQIPARAAYGRRAARIGEVKRSFSRPHQAPASRRRGCAAARRRGRLRAAGCRRQRPRRHRINRLGAGRPGCARRIGDLPGDLGRRRSDGVRHRIGLRDRPQVRVRVDVSGRVLQHHVPPQRAALSDPQDLPVVDGDHGRALLGEDRRRLRRTRVDRDRRVRAVNPARCQALDVVIRICVARAATGKRPSTSPVSAPINCPGMPPISFARSRTDCTYQPAWL